jgi:hypothetical protein
VLRELRWAPPGQTSENTYLLRKRVNSGRTTPTLMAKTC